MKNTFAERIACSQDEKFIRAWRALQQGKATEIQQKAAWHWLMQKACRVSETTFWPGDPTATAFLEGRRSIGVDAVALIEAPIKEEKKTDG